jgi:hypothetical protein
MPNITLYLKEEQYTEFANLNKEQQKVARQQAIKAIEQVIKKRKIWGFVFMETQKHLLLKEQAIRYLKSIGYKDCEIHEEYPYKSYLIDIAAIDSESHEKVLIECGTISLKKYEELRSDQDIKFIHLPYITKSIKIPPSAKKEVVDGIVNCTTNIIRVSNSKYIRLPYLLFTDSAFPFSEKDTLTITIENDQLLIEKRGWNNEPNKRRNLHRPSIQAIWRQVQS